MLKKLLKNKNLKMKFLCVLMFFVVFQHCSFDDKSGIWKNETNLSKKDSDLFKEFETISASNKIFNKKIPIKKIINLF